MTVLQLKLNEKLFLKEPQSSELGNKIIKYSIQMIDTLGFERFTFKKLSSEIGSTEASIYRYFENKHRLLVYLISWYWTWLEYRIEYEIHHIDSPKDRLIKALQIITEKKVNDENFPDVDEAALQRIVISESDKTYFTKNVDLDNNEGLFKGYKSLCEKLSQIILQINPDFRYPHALISTTMEAANHQIFFADHLPSLTELSKMKDPFQSNFEFLQMMVLNTISDQHE